MATNQRREISAQQASDGSHSRKGSCSGRSIIDSNDDTIRAEGLTDQRKIKQASKKDDPQSSHARSCDANGSFHQPRTNFSSCGGSWSKSENKRLDSALTLTV